MKEKVKIMAFWAGVTLCILFLLAWASDCSSELQSNRSLLKKNNPEAYSRTLCNYKKAGSRPACWTEGDWIAFCKKVKCMEDKE